MNAIDTELLVPSAGSNAPANSVGALAGEDFLRLLITQLTTQDPLEPTGNEEMLRQIASIREIELSTALTESLGLLTSQQRFASASALIGQYVTGIPGADGAAASGVVTGVRFESDGAALLRLSNGTELPLNQVSTVEAPLKAAEALVGKTVVGLDGRRGRDSELVEGVVNSARLDELGEVLLELDTGQDLRLRDVVSATGDA